MKKIIAVVCLLSLLVSSNVMAWWLADADIDKIQFRKNGTVDLTVHNTTITKTAKINGFNLDMHKAMVATLLTAQSSGKKVSLEVVDGMFIEIIIFTQ